MLAFVGKPQLSQLSRPFANGFLFFSILSHCYFDTALSVVYFCNGPWGFFFRGHLSPLTVAPHARFPGPKQI